MNQEDALTFVAAIAFAQAGEIQEAHQRLTALLKVNNNHREPNLLLWFAYTSPKLEQRKVAIEMVALLDPDNPNLSDAREWLKQQEQS